MRFYLVLLIAFYISGNAFSQVTIGSEAQPVAGALLQLKQNENVGINSVKGLGLPRISLTKFDDLTDIGTGLNKAEHIGLLIYNVEENMCSFTPTYKGLYVWDGEQWDMLGSENKSSTYGVYVDNRDPANPETYQYSQFGSAGTWMLENMRAKRFEGETTDIPYHTGISSSTPKIIYASGVYPNTLPVQKNRNGMLYNWAAATNSYTTNVVDQGQVAGPIPGSMEVENNGTSGEAPNKYVQGICPNGWKVPSDRDWNLLEKEMYTSANKYSTYTIADVALFSPTSWNSAWETGEMDRRGSSTTNIGHPLAMRSVCAPVGSSMQPGCKSLNYAEGGFNLLMSGYVYLAYAYSFGEKAYLWTSSTSTLNGTTNWVRVFNYIPNQVDRWKMDSKTTLLSVRCKKVEN